MKSRFAMCVLVGALAPAAWGEIQAYTTIDATFPGIDVGPVSPGAGTGTQFVDLTGSATEPRALAITDDYLFFSTHAPTSAGPDNFIKRVNRTTKAVDTFNFTTTDDTTIYDIHFDAASDALYFTDGQFGTRSISKLGLSDLTNPATAVTPTTLVGNSFFDTTGIPNYLTVVGSDVFYTDFLRDGVYKVSTSGGTPTLVTATPAGTPRGITSDGTFLYWIDNSGDNIVRSLLDGSAITEIVDLTTVQSDQTPTPNDLEYFAGKLYWTEEGDNDGVYVANADGSNAGLLYATEARPIGLAVVPEPGSLALLGLGGLALVRRRR